MNSESKKTYLDVPFDEKDKAKKLGAWWDPDVKKWFAIQRVVLFSLK